MKAIDRPRIMSEIVSQTPVRDMAAIWVSGDRLKAAHPVIAQAVVKRTWIDDDVSEIEFNFLVHSIDSDSELVRSEDSFPYDMYGAAWIVPCSSSQWQLLFCGSDAILSVATELCEINNVELTGWHKW